MNLTSRTLLSLLDNINENSKSEIVSEVISRIPIQNLINHTVVIQKYKDEIFKNDYLTPETKLVIEHSYDSFFLLWCYTDTRFLNRLNTRMFILNLYTFYYIFQDNIHITTEDVFLQNPVQKKPFNLQKILTEENINMDQIYVDEYEIFEGTLVIRSSIKWYESLQIFKFSPI